VFLVEDMTEEQRNELYNCFDAFVCPSRAEAFGLTFLEAMSCAKPCIAGAYGGQSDFVNGINGWLLEEFELKQSGDPNPIYEGVKWAEYEAQELRALMREAFRIKDIDIFQEKCQHAYLQAKEYSWEQSARQILEAMNK
jgi:glycosyltransferase involved in cell wall biosynthesis